MKSRNTTIYQIQTKVSLALGMEDWQATDNYPQNFEDLDLANYYLTVDPNNRIVAFNVTIIEKD